eukprot:5227800-Karenia_brevis.AAC.1
MVMMKMTMIVRDGEEGPEGLMNINDMLAVAGIDLIQEEEEEGVVPSPPTGLIPNGYIDPPPRPSS